MKIYEVREYESEGGGRYSCYRVENFYIGTFKNKIDAEKHIEELKEKEVESRTRSLSTFKIIIRKVL